MHQDLKMMAEEFTMTPEELEKLKHELAESKALLERRQDTIKSLTRDKEGLQSKHDELEKRLSMLESEYEELLDRTIAEEEQNTDIEDTITELKVGKNCQFGI